MRIGHNPSANRNWSGRRSIRWGSTGSSGDDNGNAAVGLEYRPVAPPPGFPGAPLARGTQGAPHRATRQPARCPRGGLALCRQRPAPAPGDGLRAAADAPDPDGKDHDAAVVRVLRAQHAVRADRAGGHAATACRAGLWGRPGYGSRPLPGLEAAQKAAAPGDLFLLHGGVYTGHWVVNRSGTPERPIIWRGRHDAGGPAVIDGRGSATSRPPHAIEASGTHDVWFEDLTVRNALHGVTFHDAARIVVRRCHIRQRRLRHERRPKHARGRPGSLHRRQRDRRAIDLAAHQGDRGGARHPDHRRGACRLLQPHPGLRRRHRHVPLAAMRGHRLPQQRPERADRRRHRAGLLRAEHALLLQPADQRLPGHLDAAGLRRPGLRLPQRDGQRGRRAVQAAQQPLRLPDFPQHVREERHASTALDPEPVRHCLMRNNLFVGTAADYAFDTTAPMVDCDFDYDGFGGGPFRLFLRWNGTRYATLDEVRKRAPVLKHAVQVDAATAFASRALPPQDVARPVLTPPDLRPAPGSKAVDAGEIRPGWNDGIPRPTPGPWRLRARRPAAPLWAQDGRRGDSRRSGCGADASVPAMKRGSAAEPPPTARPSGAARCRSRLCRRSVTRGDRRQSRLLQQDPREPDHESRPFVNRSRKSA